MFILETPSLHDELFHATIQCALIVVFVGLITNPRLLRFGALLTGEF